MIELIIMNIISIMSFIGAIVLGVSSYKSGHLKKRRIYRIMTQRELEKRRKKVYGSSYKTIRKELLKNGLVVYGKKIPKKKIKTNDIKIQFSEEKALRPTIEKNSIIDEMYKKRNERFNYVLFLTLVSIELYIGTNEIFSTDIQMEVLYFLCVLTILVIILKRLLFYRIKKGYYGMNYEECRELMKYLLNDVDKNDIDKGKKVFNEADDYGKAKEKDPAIVGEPQY